MSRAYAAFRFALVQRILAEHLTPAQTSDALEAEGLAQVCYQEIDLYRRWGDTWPCSTRWEAIGQLKAAGL